ncbi:TroA family protein [Jatrophihabitans fulvus]
MPRPLLRAALAALTLGALSLTACSTSTTDEGPSNTAKADAGAFPVTMKHAFGSTEITTAPKRVVALGWGVAEASLAVGVVPTAMEYQAYAGGDDGVLPWVEKKIETMGATMPTVLPQATEAPAYDAIRKANPDLILATYSGITKEQYGVLTAIAPTVAYTGKPYTTPWRDNIEQVAQALGRADQGAQVLKTIDAQIAREAAEHPELKGRTVAALLPVKGTIYVYKAADARVGFMLDLGPVIAPSVDSLANGDESFYYTLSPEKLDQLDSDILVTYFDDQAASKQFFAQSYAKGIPAVKSGAVADIVGVENVSAVSPPTALSLPTALPGLVDKLAAAAKKADAAG